MKMFHFRLFVMKLYSEELNPWYITGLCDGEAAFTFSRTGFKSLSLYFAIKLTRSDKGYLGTIRDYFGTGKIYYVKPLSAKENAGWTKSAAYYRVSKLSELEKIINHFDKYPLQSQKVESYRIWRKIFFLKKSGFRKPDYIKINELIKQLSESSPRNQPWDGTN